MIFRRPFPGESALTTLRGRFGSLHSPPYKTKAWRAAAPSQYQRTSHSTPQAMSATFTKCINEMHQVKSD